VNKIKPETMLSGSFEAASRTQANKVIGEAIILYSEAQFFTVSDLQVSAEAVYEHDFTGPVFSHFKVHYRMHISFGRSGRQSSP
jgi:hypothetical protein